MTVFEPKPDFVIFNCPGNELIPASIDNLSYEKLMDYFNARVSWQDYTLVHDRLITYGLFFDLEWQLPKNSETLSVLLDYAIQIAELEKEKKDRFYCTLALIEGICKKLVKYKDLHSIQCADILSFGYLVEKYKDLPNINCFWKTLHNMCIKIQE